MSKTANVVRPPSHEETIGALVEAAVAEAERDYLKLLKKRVGIEARRAVADAWRDHIALMAGERVATIIEGDDLHKTLLAFMAEELTLEVIIEGVRKATEEDRSHSTTYTARVDFRERLECAVRAYLRSKLPAQ